MSLNIEVQDIKMPMKKKNEFMILISKISIVNQGC